MNEHIAEGGGGVTAFSLQRSLSGLRRSSFHTLKGGEMKLADIHGNSS